MDRTKIEEEITEKILTYPRVTPQDIIDVVDLCQFHVFEGSQTTVCCLTLKNGFTTVGVSACASPENFDAELGEKIARQKADDQIWVLEGYLLRQELSEEKKNG